jgi:hypothetical protein
VFLNLTLRGARVAARIGRRCWVLAFIVEGAPVLLDRVRSGRCHHEFGLHLISRRCVVDALGSKTPKPISPSKPAFCPGERRARHSRKFGRQVRRRQQTAFRVSRWRRPVLSLAARRTELHRSCGTEPSLDMLMTLQGVYEKSLGTLSPIPRRAPRWTRLGQWASSIYRSLTERLSRRHSPW